MFFSPTIIRDKLQTSDDYRKAFYTAIFGGTILGIMVFPQIGNSYPKTASLLAAIALASLLSSFYFIIISTKTIKERSSCLAFTTWTWLISSGFAPTIVWIVTH